MFSSTTTELSISREKARASPPSTMELIEPPPALMARNAASADSGIDSITARVARKLAEEDQDHQRGEHQPDAAFVAQVRDRGLHEDRLIEHHPRHQRLGNIEQVLQRVADSVDDRDGVAVAALLQDRQIDRALAVDAHDVGLDGVGVLGIANIGDHEPGRCPRLFSGRRLISSVVGSWLLV